MIAATIPRSPEYRLLLEAITPTGAQGHPIPALLPVQIDWPRLRRLVVKFEIFPLVNRFLGNQPSWKEGLPDEELREWRRQAQGFAMQSLVTARQLLSILELCKQEDIPVIPFKGPVLSLQAYGDIALRQYTDLDFFTAPERYLDLYQLLKKTGFSLLDNGLERMLPLWARSGRDLTLRNSRIVLDIHTRLIQGPAFFAIPPAMWQRIQTLELFNRQVPILSPEDTLVVLALHGARNNWTSLKHIADCAHLMARCAPLDWMYILERMHRTGCLRILETMLSTVQDISRFPIPQEYGEALDRQFPIRRPAFRDPNAGDNPLALDNKDDDDHLAILATMTRAIDSPLKRLRYLLYFLCTPTSEDARMLKLPGFLTGLYSLIRPARLLAKGIGRLFHLSPKV